MTLEVGSRYGPYAVTAKIREGGMGQVCRARVRGYRNGRSRLQERRATARAIFFVAALLMASSQAWAQLDDVLIAEATAPLDEDLRDDAMVSVTYPDGHRRVLQRGANGWLCQLDRVSSGFAQCYEGQARQLFVSAVGQDGASVHDLRANELRVEADGQPCTVMGLQPETQQMKIALLVDNSAWAAQALNSPRDGLESFLDALPAQHAVGLFTISGPIRRRADFTTDRELLKQQVAGLYADSSATMLLERLLETWDRRFDAEDAWPVFVVVAHGSRSVQRFARYAEFVTELRARAGTVHAILISTGGGTAARFVSRDIARRTGGTFRSLAATTSLPRVLGELAMAIGTHHEEVRDRYRIVFACEDDASMREIRVGVNRQGIAVRLFFRPSDRALIPEVTCVDASDWFWPPWAALLRSHVGPPHSLVAPDPRRPARRQTRQHK